MTAMNEVNTVNERNMDMEGKAVKEKRTYTVKEIQEILDVSKPTVYALLKRKEFHSIIIGGKHLISKKSFDAWLDVWTPWPLFASLHLAAVIAFKWNNDFRRDIVLK